MLEQSHKELEAFKKSAYDQNIELAKAVETMQAETKARDIQIQELHTKNRELVEQRDVKFQFI